MSCVMCFHDTGGVCLSLRTRTVAGRQIEFRDRFAVFKFRGCLYRCIAKYDYGMATYNMLFIINSAMKYIQDVPGGMCQTSEECSLR